MFIGQHEVINKNCIHCGAHEDAIRQGEANKTPLTCPTRQPPRGEEVRPEPAIRESVVDDANFISQRLAELAKERDTEAPAALMLRVASGVGAPLQNSQHPNILSSHRYWCDGFTTIDGFDPPKLPDWLKEPP